MSIAGRRAILLVEDDPLLRELLGELLRHEGYEVFEAADGGAAIAALDDRRPPPDSLGLVILDMMLPVADGTEVLAALAGWGSYVPVVAVSADGHQLRRAADAGAGEILP